MNNRIVRTDKPTFVVSVKFCQNSTWQGTVKWLEGGLEKNFRSALELMKLIDDALVVDERATWEAGE